MVRSLAELPLEFDFVYNQILSNTVIPSYDNVSQQLIRLAVSHMFGQSLELSINSFAFYSHFTYWVDEVEIMVTIVVNIVIATFVNCMAILRQIDIQRPDNNSRKLILLKSFRQEHLVRS